jgi:hypothetical protein
VLPAASAASFCDKPRPRRNFTLVSKFLLYFLGSCSTAFRQAQVSESFTDHGKPWSGIWRTVSQRYFSVVWWASSSQIVESARYEIICFNNLRRFTWSRVVFIQPDPTRGLDGQPGQPADRTSRPRSGRGYGACRFVGMKGPLPRSARISGLRFNCVRIAARFQERAGN